MKVVCRTSQCVSAEILKRPHILPCLSFTYFCALHFDNRENVPSMIIMLKELIVWHVYCFHNLDTDYERILLVRAGNGKKRLQC